MDKDVITYSAACTACHCMQKYKWKYEDRLEKTVDPDTEALYVGNLAHAGLDMFAKRGLEAALEHITDCVNQSQAIGDEDVDKLMEYGAKASAIVRIASIRWPEVPTYSEKTLSARIVNPSTQGVSRSFCLGGKLDRLTANGEIIDYKVVANAADFIRRKTIGYQMDVYAIGLMEEGVTPSSAIYRVIERPTIKRRQVPQLDDALQRIVLDENGQRVYKSNNTPRQTADSAKGYYLQTQLEDVYEFEDRCLEWLYDTTERAHLQEFEIFFNEGRLEQAKHWLWNVTQSVLEARNAGRWLKNELACHTWNRACEYSPLCEAASSGDDYQFLIETQYQVRETTHPELRDAA